MDSYSQTFEAIYKQHYSALVHYAESKLLTSDFAEDTVQNVYARFWELRNTWSKIDNHKSYIFSMLKHLCTRVEMEKSRNRNLLDEMERLGDNSVPSDHSDPNLALITKAINQLPPRQQIIFRLRAERRWKRKKIADALDLSEFTVKCHLQTARKTLRALLEGNKSAA